MLKHLQKSVEEEELVWKAKMADSEEQLRVVSYIISLSLICFPTCVGPNLTTVPLAHYQVLESVSKLEAENQTVEQVGLFFTLSLVYATR